MRRINDVSDIREMENTGDDRRFILSFSSQEPYQRCWGNEILDHSEGAMDTRWLDSAGVLLFNHNRDRILGKINRVWIENERGMAEVEFDRDKEAEIIFQKVKSGTLKGVSVGYTIDRGMLEEVPIGKTSKDGRFIGPCSVARRWNPYEISIVSVPADITVGVGREKPPVKPGSSLALSCFEAQLQINQNKG